jgi:hypothetical protein
MRVREFRWVVAAALLGSAVVGPTSARADDAACIASSEREVLFRKQLRLREALRELVVCTAPACPAEVRTECNRRLTDVNQALPTVVITATDGAGNDLTVVTVKVDGIVLTSSLDGRALPVDPGSHVFTFQAEAAGTPMVQKTYVVGEGIKDRHIEVVLGGAPAAAVLPVSLPVALPPAPASASPATGPAPAEAPAASPSHPSQGGGARRGGFAVTGVGVVGVAVASVLGGLAISKSSSAKGECVPTGVGCAGNSNPAAQQDMQTASTFAVASTATFIAGGAVAAVGLVMILVGGPTKSTTGLSLSPVLLAHGGGGLGFSGAW